jgi:flavodoxin
MARNEVRHCNQTQRVREGKAKLVPQGIGAGSSSDGEFCERGKEHRQRVAEKKKSKTVTGGYIGEARQREGDM